MKNDQMRTAQTMIKDTERLYFVCTILKTKLADWLKSETLPRSFTVDEDSSGWRLAT